MPYSRGVGASPAQLGTSSRVTPAISLQGPSRCFFTIHKTETGLDFQVKVLKTVKGFPSSLGSGAWGVRTGSWTGPPQGKRAARVGVSSTVFGVRGASVGAAGHILARHPQLRRSRARAGAASAHVRQPRPDSGLAFQVKVLEPFSLVPPSLPLRSEAVGVGTSWERARLSMSMVRCRASLSLLLSLSLALALSFSRSLSLSPPPSLYPSHMIDTPGAANP